MTSTSSELPPNTLREIFLGSLDNLFTKLDILTRNQKERSLNAQAVMIIIRDAIQDERLNLSDIPELKGKPDLLKLATIEHAEIRLLFAKDQISSRQVEQAKSLVDSDQDINRPDDQIQIPSIGEIHVALYANREIKQAALAAQQTIQAANTAVRLHNGEFFPTLYQTKKATFDLLKNSDNNNPTLVRITTLHEELSHLESQQQKTDITQHSQSIEQAFDGVALLFEQVGETKLANYIRTIGAHNKGVFQSMKKRTIAPKNTRK